MSNWGHAVVIATSLTLGGCAAPQRQLRDENRRLAVEAAELRAHARAERRRLRDLEHRLAQAEAGADAVVVQAAPTAPPIEPPAAAPPAAEPMTADDGRAVHVGHDDDGVEIIYEGEAARSTGRRPVLTLRERAGRRASIDAPPGPAEIVGPSLDLPLSVATVGELSVTRGAVPTVDAQLRRARSAPLRARGPAGDPQAEYRRYIAALRAGNHAYAITGFRHFLERYPDHDFADNAQYWLGESFYDQKDYAGAAGEFRRVVDRYPRGNKVADALLKLGFCHAALGKLDEARAVLRRVVEGFPDSPPSRLAKGRLGSLDKAPSARRP